jgi:sporulation protein YlmC with PRC-barrel domain
VAAARRALEGALSRLDSTPSRFQQEKRGVKMSESKAMSVTKELKGRSILNSGTGERLGEVEDVFIHPTEGRVLGISLRAPDGRAQGFGVRDFLIGPDAVMVSGDARPELPGESGALAEGVTVRELTGTNVVSADGRLLGRVSDVYISLDQPRAAYHVAHSTLQRFFGGGFYLAGDVPRAYAPDGARLIVPEDAEHRFAASSLGEALGMSTTAA